MYFKECGGKDVRDKSCLGGGVKSHFKGLVELEKITPRKLKSDDRK